MRKDKETKEETMVGLDVWNYGDSVFNDVLENAIYNWSVDDQRPVEYVLGFDIEKNRNILKKLEDLIVTDSTKTFFRLNSFEEIGIQGIWKRDDLISEIHLTNGGTIHFIDMVDIFFKETISDYVFDCGTVLGDFPVNTKILNSRLKRNMYNITEPEYVKYSEGLEKEIQNVIKYFGYKFTGFTRQSGLDITPSFTITFER